MPLSAIPSRSATEQPSDQEIQQKIVYQLHQLRCYGGKHTSGEHFGSGYAATVPERRIRQAVKALLARDILRKHAKDPPHYSLNSDQKGAIAEILGVPGRDIETENGGEAVPEAAASRSNGNGDSRRQSDFVEKGSYENTVRVLKERLEAIERDQRSIHANAQTKAEGAKLTETLRKLQEDLDGLRESIFSQTKKIEQLKEALEAASKDESPLPDDEGGAPTGQG